MGDGGCLAFFQFPPDALGPADKLPRDAVDHHIALSVVAFDDIVRFKAKFDTLGYANCGINHGFCYSLYVRDPNDMLVELSVNASNELELGEAAAAAAHKELAEWTKKNFRDQPQEGRGDLPASDLAARGDRATRFRC